MICAGLEGAGSGDVSPC
uniref:Uncharacterized protein n=1 Tax=Anguilla anguilla TaxID=7936 RepID=A0A0E9S6Y0_ANGAN